MKKTTLLLLTALSFIAVEGFAQVRPDIIDDLTSAEPLTLKSRIFLTECIT